MNNQLLLALLATPWLGAIGLSLLGRRWGRANGWIAVATVAAALGLLAALARGLEGGAITYARPWIPALGVDLALRLDALSLPFVANALGVGLIAAWFGWGYLCDDGRLHLFYALLLGFLGAMLGALLADDALVFFGFWESMLVTTALLLAGWGEGQDVSRVVLKYVIYTQAGSLLVLGPLVWLVTAAGGSDLSLLAEVARALPREAVLWPSILLLVGFGVKLAVFPLHTWLPDAHSVAPMPVTIMLAAAMLAMGAYGIARFVISLMGSLHASLQLPLMVLALVSQVYGALMCLGEHDIKRIVAYSSVSQMGYVLFALASLTPRGFAGGAFHIISHGVVKALLFAAVGLIIRGTSRRRIEDLGGLRHRMPGVSVGLAVGSLAIAGMPPMIAFHSEWMIFAGGLASPYHLLGYLELLVPLLTASYALWFAGRLVLAPEPAGLAVAPLHWAMRGAFQVLVALALLLGLFPSVIYGWAEGAATLLTRGGW